MTTDRWHFACGRRDDAQRLVLTHHYSHAWPSNVELIYTAHESGGLFGDAGECVAACIFCKANTWRERVVELKRLVKVPNCSLFLTGLISFACDRIKKEGEYDLLISYADATQGHHGGIYQASSWVYAKQTSPARDGLMIDGEFVAGYSCNSRYGTRSLEAVRRILGASRVQPHYDAGKHLYWRALAKSGRKKAERLGLTACPYPKPDRQEAA
jgi:hypothetical protein